MVSNVQISKDKIRYYHDVRARVISEGTLSEAMIDSLGNECVVSLYSYRKSVATLLDTYSTMTEELLSSDCLSNRIVYCILEDALQYKGTSMYSIYVDPKTEFNKTELTDNFLYAYCRMNSEQELCMYITSRIV